MIAILPSYLGRRSENDLIGQGTAFHERSTDFQFVELHVLERVEALLEHFHK